MAELRQVAGLIVGLAMASACSSGNPEARVDAETPSTNAVQQASTTTITQPSTSQLRTPTAESSALPQPIAQLPVGMRAISPAGDFLYTYLPEGDCVVRIEDGATLGCFVDDDPERLNRLKQQSDRYHNTAFVWSDDGSNMAFVALGGNEVSVIDLESGQFSWAVEGGRTTAVDNKGVSQRPVDFEPAWLTNESLIFQSKLGTHYTVQIADLSTRSITKIIELPTRTDSLDRQVRRTNGFTPLVVDEHSVFLAGDGALFELDPMAPNPTFNEVVDFSSSYAGAATNIVPAGDLVPLAQIADNIMLMRDRLMRDRLMRDRLMDQAFSRDRGVTSGGYLLDMTTGSLSPLFEKSTDEDPWHGPTKVWVSPDQTRIVVAWADPKILHPKTGFMLVNLSMLDLESETLPVNPRDLPLLWGPGTSLSVGSYGDAQNTAGVWTSQDTIAFGTLDGQTIVISVAAAP